MSVALYIAKRYFREKKRKGEKRVNSKGMFSGKNFIRFLTNLSMFGVSIGTAALIVVLSVFNGLEGLTKGMFRLYNPELKVSIKQGKSFEATPELTHKIEEIPYVAAVTKVIEDNALLKYKDEQLVVNVKGVDANFLTQTDLSEYLLQGELVLSQDNYPKMILGAGVAYQLSVQVNNKMVPLEVWYPKRDRKLSLNPERAFYRQSILPSGIFSLEQNYDFNNVIVPIEFMEKLLKYEGRLTSLEIKATEKDKVEEVKQNVGELLGSDFTIQTAEEQQATVLKAVKLERLFGFITFAVILGIASFNVFFSLAMLTIEKRKDIAVLLTMGATPKIIRSIFLLEGAMIAFIGGGVGLLIGFTICFVQQEFGVVTLGVATSVVEAYPVKLELLDFIFSGFTVIAITLIASIIPAQKAAKTSIAAQL